MAPGRKACARAAMAASLRSAPRRSAATSSADFTRRSPVQAALRSTTSGTCSASSRYWPKGNPPTSPIRPGSRPRAAIRASAVATTREPAHSTRTRERRRACGTWLKNATRSTSSFSSIPATSSASRVTGHPVSHETALPDRFAPYTSACDTPPRSSTAPNAARRRRISASENSVITLSLAGSGLPGS